MPKPFWIIVISMAVAVPAWADEVDDRAKVLFDEASALFNEGQYAAAAARFREADTIRPSWKLQYNIGQAESASKQYGPALVAFERYLAEGGDDVPEKRYGEVMDEIRRLREMVASLDVKGPEGAQVVVDEVVRGTLPLEGVLKISAGRSQKVEVRLGEDILDSRNVRASGGDTVVIDLTPPAMAENATAPPPDITRSEPVEEPIRREPVTTASSDTGNGRARKLKLAGGILLGVGSAAAVAGAVFGGLAIDRAGVAGDLCPERVCTTDDAKYALWDGLTFGILANVLISAGAVVGTTGLVLLIVGTKKERADRMALTPIPSVGPGFGALTLEGRF